MTYNERHSSIQFSQGQVAVVTELADDILPSNDQRCTVRLAPPGVRNIDIANIPDNWPQVSVKRRTTHAIVVGHGLQMGRRTQFPLRYHLTSTIHRIQGETVPLYATQISQVNKSYRLWQKEQFAVLISRAHTCRDIIFVGAKTDTRNAIVQILAKSSKWDDIVNNYLTTLDVMSRPVLREINLNLHPFLPFYRELPNATCGYVYILASIPNSSRSYVGECADIKKRLREHNTGYGTTETKPTCLHPWGIYGFVCGFDDVNIAAGITSRKQFLRELHFTLDPVGNAEQAYNSIRILVASWNEVGYSLVIVKCGQLPISE